MTVHVVAVEEFAQLTDRVRELEARVSAATEQWPEWMSVETASRYLDISPQRLWKLKQRGHVPYYQDGPGCRVFFRRAELDAAMETHRGGDAQTAATTR